MSSPEFRDMSFVIDDPFYGRIFPDYDDVVMRYKKPQYDHIRYHAQVVVEQEGQQIPLFMIRCLFIGATALDGLARLGIPETYADQPTQGVYNAFTADELSRLDDELGDIVE